MDSITWIRAKRVCIYLSSVDLDNHLNKKPLTNDSKQQWIWEDACLFFQICNSINSEVIVVINHCDFVKELIDYLDFLYCGKGNIACIFDVCKAFYRLEK